MRTDCRDNNSMTIKEKLLRLRKKWGNGGIKRSLERKKARREAKKEKANAQPNLLKDRFPQCASLPTFWTDNAAAMTARRLTMVTDSINASSLFGGVGTALILACEICRHHQAALRIVTRIEPPDTSRLQDALRLFGITLPPQCEFVFSPPCGATKQIGITEGDIFLTTSWWTTAATIQTVPPQKVRYLIQEDERMFYPFGDDRLRCESIMGNINIPLFVNSSLLHQHFKQQNIPEYENRAQFFEPSFPASVYQPRPKSGKNKLFFYARPNNPRNLFWLGVQVLQEAVSRNLLPAESWEICLVGNSVPSTALLGQHPYKVLESMKWSDYAELIGRVDVGLSLMYTPHPSYPPLDLAASGALVVTNRFGCKQNLSHYSDSIICADPDVSSLVAALAEAIEQVNRGTANKKRDSKLPGTWQESLMPIVESFRFN